MQATSRPWPRKTLIKKGYDLVGCYVENKLEETESGDGETSYKKEIMVDSVTHALSLRHSVCTNSDFSPAFLFWQKKENMGAVYLPLIIQPVEAYRTHIPSLVSLAVGGTVTYPRSDAYVPLQQPRSYLQPWMALTPWRTGPNNTQTLRLPGSLCPERCPPARWNYRLRWQPNTQRMEISFPSILICHKRKVNGHPMRYTI